MASLKGSETEKIIKIFAGESKLVEDTQCLRNKQRKKV